MNSAVSMVRWRVHGVEFHRFRTCVDDVVRGASRNQNSRTVLNRVPNVVEGRFPFSGFDAKKLIELMHLFAYFLSRLQRHKNELTIFRSIQDAPEIVIIKREFFYIYNVSSHIVMILHLRLGSQSQTMS